MTNSENTLIKNSKVKSVYIINSEISSKDMNQSERFYVIILSLKTLLNNIWELIWCLLETFYSILQES